MALSVVVLQIKVLLIEDEALSNNYNCSYNDDSNGDGDDSFNHEERESKSDLCSDGEGVHVCCEETKNTM